MIKKIFIYISVFALLLLPVFNILAEGNDTGPGQPTTISFQLTNPLDLPDDANLIDLLEMLVDGAMYIAIPIIVLLIIYTGLKFVMAQGNDSKIKDAKQMFFYVIIGTAIILGAKIIVEIIQATIESLQTTS